MEEGGRRPAGADRRAAPQRSTRSRVGRSGSRRSPPAAARPRRTASRRSGDCRDDRAEPVIERPAILAPVLACSAASGADIGPGPGAEHAVVGDMLEQQHILMLALDHRHRHAGPGQRAQHRRLGADRGAALGDGAAPVGPAQQQHLGEIAARQPLEPLLGNAGQLGDPAGECGHPRSLSLRARPRAPAVTSAQVSSKAHRRHNKDRRPAALPAPRHGRAGATARRCRRPAAAARGRADFASRATYVRSGGSPPGRLAGRRWEMSSVAAGDRGGAPVGRMARCQSPVPANPPRPRGRAAPPRRGTPPRRAASGRYCRGRRTGLLCSSTKPCLRARLC